MKKERWNVSERVMTIVMALILVLNSFGGIIAPVGAVNDPESFRFCVTENDGTTPIENATVSVWWEENSFSENTDSNGYVSFSRITQAAAEKGLKLSYSAFAENHGAVGGELEITKEQKAEEKKIKLLSAQTALISGKVSCEEQELKGVPVSISNEDEVSVQLLTDDSGCFEYLAETEKEYTLDVSLPLYLPYSDEFTLTADGHTADVSLTAKAEQTTFVFEKEDPQEVTWAAESTFTNTASGGESTGEITYKITNVDSVTENEQSVPCASWSDQENGVLNLDYAGSVTVTAKKAGDDNYLPAEISYTLTINKAEQTTFAFENGEETITQFWSENGTYTNTASGGESTNTDEIVYKLDYVSKQDETPCVSLDTATGEITIATAGEAIINATRKGDNRYADKTIAYKLIVKKADQSSFIFEKGDTEDNKAWTDNVTWSEGATYTNTALKGETDGTVTYEIIFADEITVGGEDIPCAEILDPEIPELTLNGAGKVVVEATKKGDELHYADTTISYELTIDKAEQTTFVLDDEKANKDAEAADTWGRSLTWAPDSTYAIAVDGGESEADEYTYEIDAADDITVSGGEMKCVSWSDQNNGILQLNGAGTATVKITKVGDARYADKTVTLVLTIGRAENSAEFKVAEPSKCWNTLTFSNTIKDNKSEGEISYQVTSADKVTIGVQRMDCAVLDEAVAGQLNLNGAGNVTVEATIAADDRYEEQTISYTLEITKAAQNIAFEKPAAEQTIHYGEAYENTASETEVPAAVDGVGCGTGAIAYTIDDEAFATIDAETGALTFKNAAVGTATITATKAADDRYEQATASYELTVKYLKVPEAPIGISGDTKNLSGWYTGDITLTAPDGYKIAKSNLIAGEDKTEWEASVTVEREGTEDETVYLRKSDTGGITDAITYTGDSALKLDKTLPSELGISYADPVKEIVLDVITFKFYEKNIDVTLSAKDEVSGIQSFSYKLHDTDDPTTVVPNSTEEDGAPAYKFSISPQFRGKLSFTATDTAGNESSLTDTKDEKPVSVIVDTMSPTADMAFAGTYVRSVDDTTGIDSPAWTDTENSKAENARYIFSSDVTATITVTEANLTDDAGALLLKDGKFYDDIIKVTVTRDGENCQVSPTWSIPETGKAQTTISLEGNGDYQITVAVQDYATNAMRELKVTANGEELQNNDLSGVYTSKIITVDKANPTLTATYTAENEKQQTFDGRDFYQDDTKLELTVKERNFRPADMVVTLTAKDYAGNAAATKTVAEFAAYVKEPTHWTKTGTNNDTEYTLEYPFTEEANYDLSIEYSDMANNPMDAYAQAFTVDKTDPTELTISYEKTEQTDPPTEIMECIIDAITFHYFQPSVTVKVSAKDVTAGVDGFILTYTKQSGASNTNVSDETRIAATGELTSLYAEVEKEDRDVTTSDDGNVRSATFCVPKDVARKLKTDGGQYRGSFKLTAVDRSGNTTELIDGDNIVVVDTISPERTATYSEAKQAVNKDLETVKDDIDLDQLEDGEDAEPKDQELTYYYDGEAEFELHIVEANFYAEDVTITVNDKAANGEWSHNGDEHTYTISFEEDGEYVVKATYTDRSGNEMPAYQSQKIVVDTINPELKVTYMPGEVVREIDDRRYYAQTQKVRLEIHEVNFRADDVKVTVTAEDVAGSEADVDVEAFATYLKDRDNWEQEDDDDVYVAEIEYTVDANYTFDIEYVDLALRPIEEYPSEDMEKEKFTVDTTKPTDLSISYSQSVKDMLLSAVSFGFYDAPVRVHISARDAVAGVYEFKYSYVKTPGASNVNSELADEQIVEEKITFNDGRREASADFSVPRGALNPNNQFNGTVHFTATDRSGNAETFDDSKCLVVDNISPTVTVSYNEPNLNVDNIAYYHNPIEATISIREANFYSEDVAVMVQRLGGERYTPQVSWVNNSVDDHTGTFSIAEDGDYQVLITYMDRSGNVMQDYASGRMTIDSVLPKITVDGIKNRSANKGDTIGFVLYAEDVNLNENSIRPVLTATVMDEKGNFTQIDCTDKGSLKMVTPRQKYSYTVENLDVDGVYSLECEVADRSGNVSKQLEIIRSDTQKDELLFSVNRFGSTFGISKETAELNGTFAHDEIDVVVFETNADELEEQKLTLFKNDETIALQQNTDFTVSHENEPDEWNIYEYTVLKKNFAADGIYRLNVHSKDAAGNVAENTQDSKNVEIGFAIDKTNPTTVVSNLTSGTTYPEDSYTVLLSADDNLKLNRLEVYLDGEMHESWDAEQLMQMQQANEQTSFTVSGDSTKAHNVKIVATDAAGNTLQTLIEKFYVTTNLFVRYFNNKPLFFGSIAVVAAGVGLLVGLRSRKKKAGATA